MLWVAPCENENEDANFLWIQPFTPRTEEDTCDFVSDDHASQQKLQRQVIQSRAFECFLSGVEMHQLTAN